MAVGDPWPLDALSYTGVELRQGMVGPSYAHAGDGISVQPGVVSGLAATVSTLTVSVGTGTAVLTPTVGSNGSYQFSNPSTTAVVLGARDASFTRWDLIIARVYDNSADSSGQNKGAIEIVQGVASATPLEPALPAGTELLWRAQVPVSGTVVLVDRRRYTAAAGGVITCLSTTRPTGSFIRPGQLIYETDTKAVQAWDGAAWQLVDLAGTAPHAAATSAAAQSLPSVSTGLGTLMTLDTPVEAAGGAVVSGGLITVPRAGRYAISGGAMLTTGTTTIGYLRAILVISGVAFIKTISVMQTNYVNVSLAGSKILAANDTIGLYVAQTGGSPRSLFTDPQYNFLTATWVGA